MGASRERSRLGWMDSPPMRCLRPIWRFHIIEPRSRADSRAAAPRRLLKSRAHIVTSLAGNVLA